MQFIFNAIYLCVEIFLYAVHGPPGRISDDNINNKIHLALQLFDRSDNYSDLDTCYQFVMMADLVMRSLHSSWLDNESLMGTLLQKMSEAVDISLEKGYWNCGCNRDLPWISSLLPKSVSASHQFAHFPLQTVEDLPAQPLWSLIDILEKGLLAEGPNDQGQSLFTGKNIRADFIELKEQVEKFHPRPCTSAQTFFNIYLMFRGDICSGVHTMVLEMLCNLLVGEVRMVGGGRLVPGNIFSSSNSSSSPHLGFSNANYSYGRLA